MPRMCHGNVINDSLYVNVKNLTDLSPYRNPRRAQPKFALTASTKFFRARNADRRRFSSCSSGDNSRRGLRLFAA